MIRFPNEFSGTNLHLLLEAEKPINFTKFLLNDYPIEFIDEVKSIDKFFVTFSDMRSSINEKNHIEYNEIIIKIPIRFRGYDYLFPIISFVDDKYSLIRGYLMGFYKETDFVYKKEDNILFNYKDIAIDLKLQGEYKDIKKDIILSNPFILFRNFKIDDKIDCKEIIKLSLENYNEDYFKKFYGNINLSSSFQGINCNAISIYKSADRFNLIGTTMLYKIE